MTKNSYAMLHVVAALGMMGVGLSSIGDDVLRESDRDEPRLPPKQRKPRVAAVVKKPIPQGPMTRQQRRAAERAAIKRLPA